MKLNKWFVTAVLIAVFAVAAFAATRHIYAVGHGEGQSEEEAKSLAAIDAVQDMRRQCSINSIDDNSIRYHMYCYQNPTLNGYRCTDNVEVDCVTRGN